MVDEHIRMLKHALKDSQKIPRKQKRTIKQLISALEATNNALCELTMEPIKEIKNKLKNMDSVNSYRTIGGA